MKSETTRTAASASATSNTMTKTTDEYFMGFPFQPYTIQCDLMRVIHTTLDESKIGILESPTGTGKSLSLICGTLSWLERFNCQSREKLLAQSNELQAQLNTKYEEDGKEDWVQVHAKKKQLSHLKQEVLQQLQVYEWKDARSKELSDLRSSRHRQLGATSSTSNGNKRKLQVEQMQDSAPVDYQSDQDKDNDDDDDDYDAGERVKNNPLESPDEVRQVKPKVFYACRTHSQLAQFVSEVIKTRYGSLIRLVSLASRSNLCVNPAVNRAKSVSLINDRCTELMNNSSGKSKCSFMSKSKQIELRDQFLAQVHDIEDMFKAGSYSSTCPYYAARAAIAEADVIVLPYNILLHRKTRHSWGIDLKGSVVIIDEAHNLLETISSVHSAEVTLAQVNGCFNQLTAYSKRYGKQLNPKNLLYIKQLSLLLKSIVSYVKCNESRKDKPVNSESDSRCQLLATLDFVVAAGIDGLNLHKLINYCKKSQLARKLFGFSTASPPATAKGDTCSPQTNHQQQKYPEEAREGEKQQVNRSPATGTSAFLSRMKKNKAAAAAAASSKPCNNKQRANIGHTVSCCSANDSGKNTDSHSSEDKTSGQQVKAAEAPSSPLYAIIDLMQCLTNPASDGRVLITRPSRADQPVDHTDQSFAVKYFLLNSAQHFEDIVSECRSLLLAGGTMQPFAEYTQLLFKPLGITPDRLITFSCGHVIPRENIVPIALAKGVSGNALHFSYSNRCTFKLIDEAGQTLSTLAASVPGGVVAFFPSYEYLDTVHSRWSSTKLLSVIESRGKKIFREPKQASLVAKVLTEYSRANKVFEKSAAPRPAPSSSSSSSSSSFSSSARSAGAILLSVVGGKMSEGINFSDQMCRCVIVIGMPFANQRSLQLQEKIKFYEETLGPGFGKFYYDNLCFKAINQSIGRSIRHSADYSAIILMDERYTTRKDIRNKLPKWIADHLIDTVSFQLAHQLLVNFFSAR